MPNWTSNVIKVVGTAEKLQKFINQHFTTGDEEELNFNFESIIPQPQSKIECPAECLVNAHTTGEILDDRPWFDWLSWNMKFWGTKWNASHTTIVGLENLRSIQDAETPAMITVYFDTAWTAVPKVIKALLKMHPELDIRYAAVDEELLEGVSITSSNSGGIAMYTVTADCNDAGEYDQGFVVSFAEAHDLL